MLKLAAPFLLILATTIAAPAPVLAGITGRHVYGPVAARDPFIGDGRLPAPGARRDARDIRRRAERAQADGALSRREARQIKREARQLSSLARFYGRDGLSASEQRELETRAQLLRGAIDRPRLHRLRGGTDAKSGR